MTEWAKKQLAAIANGYVANDNANVASMDYNNVKLVFWDGPFSENLEIKCDDIQSALDTAKKFSDSMPYTGFRVSLLIQTSISIDMHEDRNRQEGIDEPGHGHS